VKEEATPQHAVVVTLPGELDERHRPATRAVATAGAPATQRLITVGAPESTLTVETSVLSRAIGRPVQRD
jgi:hypothetical protein